MAAIDNIMTTLNLQLSSIQGVSQQIIFNVGDDCFGLDILDIREIIRYQNPTKVPKAPEFVVGVINYRGEIIPVINLDVIFGLPDDRKYTVIVVVETGEKLYGLLVDNVLDIVSFESEQVQELPEFSRNEKTKFLQSVAKLEQGMVLMMDVDKLIDFEAVEATMDKIRSRNEKSLASKGKKVSEPLEKAERE